MSQRTRILKLSHLDEIRAGATANCFTPRGTMRCIGSPLFRTASARDVGCLLDVDPSVDTWTCLPFELHNGGIHYVPDFLVNCGSTQILIDANRSPAWAPEAAKIAGYQYQADRYDLHEATIRLANARDLLRYASYNVTLGDRIRILSLLEEHGPMPLIHCAAAIKNSSDAIGTIASLVLQRIIEIDIEDALIGPETRISRA